MKRALPLSYCADLVRRHDHDRYLCALFAPASMREAWFALSAFSHEIAVIAEMVSEPMIGYIRFAWWREALDEIYGGSQVRRHPVAEALAEVIKAHRLPRMVFDAMLAARESDIEQEPFTNFVEIEAYCRDTSSALFRLCAAVAGQEGEWLEDLGLGWAMTGMVRTGMSEAFKQELMECAAEHLEKCRAAELGTFAAFLTTAEFYLKRLRKHGSVSRSSRFLLPLALWVKSFK